MQTKFLEGFGGKLVDQWAAQLFTPAFAFWMGGLLAWGNRQNWPALAQSFTALAEPLQIAVLVGALLVVAASGFALQRFDLAILRLFEGYWPDVLDPVRDRCVRHQQKQRNCRYEHWNRLQNSPSEALSAEALEKRSALDTELRQWPANPARIMPTRFGNILRAAESRPTDRYGLDAIVCWPRLWLILPENAKKALQEARAELNNAARLWLWGILFIVWVFLGAWWAVPIGLLVAWFAYFWMLSAAGLYGELVEAAFDLYRMDLYKSLHLSPPLNAEEEIGKGKMLTEFLWRGSDRPDLRFVHPDNA